MAWSAKPLRKPYDLRPSKADVRQVDRLNVNHNAVLENLEIVGRHRSICVGAAWKKTRHGSFTCLLVSSALLSWQFCVAQILADVLETISSTCLRNKEKHPGRRCQAYLPDLLDPAAQFWPQL
jgi:hypothetical protein